MRHSVDNTSAHAFNTTGWAVSQFAAASTAGATRETGEPRVYGVPDLPDQSSAQSLRGLLGTAIGYTLVTAILLGIVYPLIITALAQLTMRDKANGQLILRDGQVIGSAIIGQDFASNRYFHGRLSAAGNGYDAANSGGSNLGQSNSALLDRINGTVAAYQQQNPGTPVPIDLVTTSASGIDPDISPAAADYQVNVVANARGLATATVRKIVQDHVRKRQLGLLGEPRVNVLELNLALDQHPRR
jgi:K+-transporting ATPase ATPase C chain